MELKSCTKCSEVKSLSDFPRDPRLKSGLSSQCRRCHAIRSNRHYAQNKERINKRSREWIRNNPDRVKARQQQKRISPEEWEVRKAATAIRTPQNIKRWQEENRDKRLADAKKWAVENPEKIKAKRLAAAERKRAERTRKTLESDLAAIRSGKLRRKKSHHKICPVLKLVPELYLEAKRRQRRALDIRRDPAAVRARTRAWKRRHPDMVDAQRSRRQATLQTCAVNDFTIDQWESMKALHDHRCFYCGKQKKLTMDHLTPISKGGHHTAGNIVPACQRCNSRKGTKDIGEIKPGLTEGISTTFTVRFEI